MVVHGVDAEGFAAFHYVHGGFEFCTVGCGSWGFGVEAAESMLEVGGEFEPVNWELEDGVGDGARSVLLVVGERHGAEFEWNVRDLKHFQGMLR